MTSHSKLKHRRGRKGGREKRGGEKGKREREEVRKEEYIMVALYYRCISCRVPTVPPFPQFRCALLQSSSPF